MATYTCFGIACIIVQFLLPFLSLVKVVYAEFRRTCPERALWDLVGNSFCPSPTKYVKYHCLEIAGEKNYTETCLPYRRVEKGVYSVLDPLYKSNIDSRPCPSDRYQPSISVTNVANICLNKKSACDEEGQVIFSNGSTKEDRSCRCDYNRGYTYVTPPKNSCSCVPSDEDCSCYYKFCGVDQGLNQDYVCADQNEILSENNTYKCPQIVVEKEVVQINYTQKDEGRMLYIAKLDNRNRVNAVISIILASVVFCLICPIAYFFRHRCKKKGDDGLSEHGKPKVQHEAAPVPVEDELNKKNVNKTKQQDKEDILDAILIYVDKEREKAKDFKNHLTYIVPDIKVALIEERLKSGETFIRATDNLFSVSRYVLILITNNFKLNKIKRFETEKLLIESLNDPEKISRFVPVTVADPKDIPEELVPLVDIKYYHYLAAKEKGMEDTVFISTIERLFEVGRKNYLV